MVRILRHTGTVCRFRITLITRACSGRCSDRPVANGKGSRRLGDEPGRRTKVDYYCWDLYAKATASLRRTRRGQLNCAEDAEVDRGRERRGCRGGPSRGGGDCRVPPADDGAVGYRLRAAGAESEILHLKFWDAAFEMLKNRARFNWRRAGRWRVADLAVEGRRKFGN